MDPNLLVQALMQLNGNGQLGPSQLGSYGLVKPKPAPTPTPAATPIPPQKPWEVPQTPPGPQASPPINPGAGSGPFDPTDTGVPADDLVRALLRLRRGFAAGNELANPGDQYVPGR